MELLSGKLLKLLSLNYEQFYAIYYRSYIESDSLGNLQKYWKYTKKAQDGSRQMYSKYQNPTIFD